MTTFAIEAVTTQEQPRQRGKYADHIERAITAGYANLARAMVQAAIQDALKAKDELTREEGAAWLGSVEGLEMAELCGFDAELIKKWYFAGCPTRPGEMLQ